MNSKKKVVLVVAVALCLVATISAGTLAWFTAQDTVTNDFLVGDSTTDPDDVFGIDVWEIVDDEEIGKDTADEEGATYEAILPGEKLSKEPYLTNTGIHPQFVRAIVTVSEATLLREAMEGAWGDAEKFLPGMGDKWTLTDILFTADDELVYVYYYTEPLEAKATTEPLFTEVVIPTGLTLEQAQAMEQFSVSILGQVIQYEHLNVETAVDAFAKYWDAEGTIAGYAAEDIKANGKVNGDNSANVPAVYYTVGEADAAEVSLTNETICAKEAVVVIPAEYSNCTVIIDSCELVVPMHHNSTLQPSCRRWCRCRSRRPANSSHKDRSYRRKSYQPASRFHRTDSELRYRRVSLREFDCHLLRNRFPRRSRIYTF